MHFDREIDGYTFIQYRKPCIYAWFRGNECLYVGKSSNGIVRPMGKHQVIGRKDSIQLTDTLYLHFPETQTNDELQTIETEYIAVLKPKYHRMLQSQVTNQFHTHADAKQERKTQPQYLKDAQREYKQQYNQSRMRAAIAHEIALRCSVQKPDPT
jgi:hypothetical protein